MSIFLLMQTWFHFWLSKSKGLLWFFLIGYWSIIQPTSRKIQLFDFDWLNLFEQNEINLECLN